MTKKKSYITLTDQFCGAGGSSIGATLAGADVRLALNHWQLAIDTHNTNFPKVDHDCTDISAVNPRRYPSTDILITSPECTNHSLKDAIMKPNLNSLLKYLPLLAPVPEGYAVGLAIARELDWHWSIVVIASIIVAGTGFWGVQVSNRMSEFNGTLSRDEQKDFHAPTRSTLIVLVIWFIGVAALTVLLDIYPILRALTPLGLVVIGFSAAYLFSLSNIQGEREQARADYRAGKRKEKEDARNLRQQERKEKKEHAQVLATIRQQVSARVNTVQGPQGTARRVRVKSGSKLSEEMLLYHWAINPYLTDSEMVTALWDDGNGVEVSRQAVGQRRAAMIKRGILRQDPDGRVVELIGEPPLYDQS